jgi:hypothetical protein
MTTKTVTQPLLIHLPPTAEREQVNHRRVRAERAKDERRDAVIQRVRDNEKAKGRE